jgi:hypothetical protein
MFIMIIIQYNMPWKKKITSGWVVNIISHMICHQYAYNEPYNIAPTIGASQYEYHKPYSMPY